MWKKTQNLWKTPKKTMWKNAKSMKKKTQKQCEQNAKSMKKTLKQCEKKRKIYEKHKNRWKNHKIYEKTQKQCEKKHKIDEKHKKQCEKTQNRWKNKTNTAHSLQTLRTNIDIITQDRTITTNPIKIGGNITKMQKRMRSQHHTFLNQQTKLKNIEKHIPQFQITIEST